GKAFPCPPGPGQGGGCAGDDRMLAVFATDVVAAAAVRLHRHRAPQIRIALAHDDGLPVLASHARGRPVQDCYTAMLYTFQQRGVQLCIRYRAAEPLYLEVAALDQRAAQA